MAKDTNNNKEARRNTRKSVALAQEQIWKEPELEGTKEKLSTGRI